MFVKCWEYPKGEPAEFLVKLDRLNVIVEIFQMMRLFLLSGWLSWLVSVSCQNLPY